MPEKGNRNAFTKLLIDKKAHHLPFAKRANHAKRGLAAFAINIAAIGFLASMQKARQKRIIQRPVNRRHFFASCQSGKGTKFPIADMRPNQKAATFKRL